MPNRKKNVKANRRKRGTTQIHFDRFRLLNQEPGAVIKNESAFDMYVRAVEEDSPTLVSPGTEVFLPIADDGSAILDIATELVEVLKRVRGEA
jgi:hypothetical protein